MPMPDCSWKESKKSKEKFNRKKAEAAVKALKTRVRLQINRVFQF